MDEACDDGPTDPMPRSLPPLRLGVLAHPFLLTLGGTDFLERLVRGLAADPSHELVFLCPPTAQGIERLTPTPVRRVLGRLDPIRRAIKRLEHSIEPATAMFRTGAWRRYESFRSACPSMPMVPCLAEPASLRRIVRSHRLHLLLPTMEPLPEDLPCVTYWTDCQSRRFPEFFDQRSRQERDARIRSLVAIDRPMIVNSRDTKSDLVRFYGADPRRIFDLPFAPVAAPDRLESRPASRPPERGPYVLVCNQFWMHKSLETALEAARIARDRRIDVRFVFTGPMEEPRRPGYVDTLRLFVRREALEERVRFLGNLPKADQLELMRHATAVVQPTLFEGGPGGGAAFDAISLGVRLVASDIPVNRELPLEPGRVELFRAGDAESLLERVEAMLDAPYRPPPIEELHRRSSLALRNLAHRLREAIDDALGPPGSRAGVGPTPPPENPPTP